MESSYDHDANRPEPGKETDMNRGMTATNLARTILLAALALLVLAPQALAEGEKVLMVVANSNYQDKEYKDSRNVFEDAGMAVTVASPRGGMATGMSGGSVSCDLAVADVDVADYDAVVFIGGQGSRSMANESQCQRVAREAHGSGKVVGAICHAPVVLALAGVLDGKEGTVYKDWGGPDILKKNGCDYKRSKVVVDGRVVTSDGPKSAKKFAKAVVEVMQIK